MPYVNKDNRNALEKNIRELVSVLLFVSSKDIWSNANEGDLNYTITELLVRSLFLDTEPKYARINTAIGVLECVKLELYRRLAAPYEDTKIASEGDIDCYKTFDEYLNDV